jgi:demethylmenaquinone methyltransferase/2-methoxy-6-polyprenyl-1,4-benzoquinol methylase
MRDYYAARAPEYDRIYQKPERQRDLRAIEAWLPGVFQGKSILEIACGTGYWTQFLAPVARNMLALDAAQETLQIAKARIPHSNVEFIEGDAYRLPADVQGYEAGFAGFWLSHVPRAQIREFLDGFHAALKPGATVVFLDNRFVIGSSTPIDQLDAGGDTYQLRTLADGSEHRVMKNFLTEAELREALVGVGHQVRFHEWESFWTLEYLTCPLDQGEHFADPG